jgi:hypothetical protein
MGIDAEGFINRDAVPATKLAAIAAAIIYF